MTPHAIASSKSIKGWIAARNQCYRDIPSLFTSCTEPQSVNTFLPVVVYSQQQKQWQLLVVRNLPSIQLNGVAFIFDFNAELLERLRMFIESFDFPFFEQKWASCLKSRRLWRSWNGCKWRRLNVYNQCCYIMIIYMFILLFVIWSVIVGFQAALLTSRLSLSLLSSGEEMYSWSGLTLLSPCFRHVTFPQCNSYMLFSFLSFRLQKPAAVKQG